MEIISIRFSYDNIVIVGACVEGGATLAGDRCTLTPLQLSSASLSSAEIVALLLAHGANGFLSTQHTDSMCFAQRGCYSAISVAAAHDQRAILRKLLSHPLAPVSREVLSLEEMLAEGDSCARNGGERSNEVPSTLSKTQIKCLQEAMYHSAENNHLGMIHIQFNRTQINQIKISSVDITIELRALGVPWTLHCWMHALSAAHELRLDSVIDQLLQDFLQVCPDDYSSQFVTECLPLLFNIFRYSKVSTYITCSLHFAHAQGLTFELVKKNKKKKCNFFRRKEQHYYWLIFSQLVSVGTPSNRSKSHCCNQ